MDNTAFLDVNGIYVNIFLYVNFRSQKTCFMQKNHSTVLGDKGLSNAAMNSGQYIGYTTTSKTRDNHKRHLASQLPQLAKTKLQAASEVTGKKCYIIIK